MIDWPTAVVLVVLIISIATVVNNAIDKANEKTKKK